MNQQSTRPFRAAQLLAGVAATGLLVLATAMAQPPAPTGGGKPITSGHKFKNIKVLKDLPADQLIPVMHKFNESLGVRCDFCHVVNADHSGFEKDDKPEKQMARDMIVMTQHINAKEKIVHGKATCAMCHHGHAEPETGVAASDRK